MLLRPEGLRLPSALSPSRKSLKVWKTEPAARHAGVVASVVLGEEEAAGARPVAAVDPGEIVGPRVVFVLGRKIVARRAEQRGSCPADRARHLRRLIEEAVGRRHPERGGGRSAIAVRALRGARETHARFVHQGLAEGGREVEAGDIVVRGERLRSSLPRNHRRARVALRRAEGAVLIDGGEVDAGGERVLGCGQIVAVDQVLVLVVSGRQAVRGEAEARVAARGQQGLGIRDQPVAARRLELQNAERDGIDRRGGAGGLIAAIELLAAGEGQVAAVERMVGGTELGGQRGGGTVVGQRRKDGVGGRSGVQSVDLPRALVGAEEEELPAADRAAQGGAELVLFEIGFGLPGGGAEDRSWR